MFRPHYIAILLLSALAAWGDGASEHLQRYVGRWVGDFTIHSTATGYSESFSVEQRYWWVEDQLKGLSVSETNTGIETAESLTYVEGDGFVSKVMRGDSTEVFYGVFHDGGVVWLPADKKRLTDYQMKESLVTEGAKELLLTEGFDSYVFQGGLAHIVYRGRLVRQAED